MANELEISISKRVNDFIDSLTEDVHTIQVETNGNETIIMYEDWTEHPPIKKFDSVWKQYVCCGKIIKEAKAYKEEKRDIKKSAVVKKVEVIFKENNRKING